MCNTLNSAHFDIQALAMGQISCFFSHGKPVVSEEKISIHLNQG